MPSSLLSVLVLLPGLAVEDPLVRGARLIADGQFEEAMEHLEKLPRDRGREGTAQRLLGQAYLGFAQARAERGAGDAGLYFADAARRFERAARAGDRGFALDRDWAVALYQLSRFDEALEPSRRAVATLPADLAANAAAAVYAQHARLLSQVLAARGTFDGPEAAEMCAAAASAAALRPSDGETRRLHANSLAWAGRDREAVDVFATVLTAEPESAETWDAWRAAGLRTGPPHAWFQERAAALAARLGTPLAQWHRALTDLRVAESLQTARDFDTARTAYEQASAGFSAVQDAAPDYRDSSTFYRAQALAGVGWCEYFAGRPREAEAWFLEALQVRPDHARTPDALGLTPVRAVEAIASRWVEEGDRARDPERLAELQLRARTLLERASEFVPDHAAWRNNLGFLYREAGTRAEQAERPHLARELYETGYAHYRRAADLAPGDARIVNDTALMLVYHLERNLDRAEEQLVEAARLAREGVAAIDRGEDPGVDRSRDELLEAGGDALQNLGYLYLVHRRDAERARSYFEAVLAFDPVRPRNAQVRQFLERIKKQVP